MTNWIGSDTEQYLKPFNCVQRNEWCSIELLLFKSNTWNSLTVGLNWIIGITKQYLEPFDCVQMNSVEKIISVK